jgi:predicted nuclease with TOPRIM domain
MTDIAASPLPEEIADHLKFLRTYSSHPGITDAADALERMAHENEELRTENAKAFARQIASEDHIREIETERDQQARYACELFDEVACLQTERDAINAKTIEECADDLAHMHISGGLLTPYAAAAFIRKKIRALNQPPEAEGKEE